MVIMEIKPVGLTWSFWSCQIPLLVLCGRRATVVKEKPDWFEFSLTPGGFPGGSEVAMQPFCLCGGSEEPLKKEQSNGAPRVKMGTLIQEGSKGIPAFVSPKLLEGHGGKKQLHLQRQDHGDTVGLALKWARGWEQCTKMDRGWVEPRAEMSFTQLLLFIKHCLFPVLLKASQPQDNPHQNTERVPNPLQLGGVRDLEPAGEGVGRVYTPGV